MFTPSRLSLARRRRGLTKKRLAELVGVTVRSIVAHESGAIVPSPDTIAHLSRVLRFPVEFFSGPDLEEPNPDGASFRALTSMTAAQRDSALAAGVLAMDAARWIDERFHLPKPNVPDVRGIEPEAAAGALRGEWGLGERPVKSMVHLLEAYGVRVFSLPTDSANVDAFSLWRHDVPFVFLNTSKSGERGRFDAAHELGHLILHRRGGPHGREAEIEADQFASAFLMPRASVLAYAPRMPTLETIIRLKRNWMVATSALVYRLRSLGLLTEWHYRQLWIQIGQRGYRREEPKGIPRETSQVLTKVFRALLEGKTTRAMVARELLMEPEDLDALMFGLMVLSVPGGRVTKGLQSQAKHLSLA
jgi:Zn-dependent peptidase ImmA (M78 family)/DNA-binding XRE family transcriptional regulator